MLQWWRRRRYEHKNRELIRSGSSAQWVELFTGDWRLVDSVNLEEPYPSLRPAKKIQMADETFYVRPMRHGMTPLGNEVPPAVRGLTIISGREQQASDKTSQEKG